MNFKNKILICREHKKKDFSHANQPEKESMPSKLHPGTLHVYSNKNLNKERPSFVYSGPTN